MAWEKNILAHDSLKKKIWPWKWQKKIFWPDWKTQAPPPLEVWQTSRGGGHCLMVAPLENHSKTNSWQIKTFDFVCHQMDYSPGCIIIESIVLNIDHPCYIVPQYIVPGKIVWMVYLRIYCSFQHLSFGYIVPMTGIPHDWYFPWLVFPIGWIPPWIYSLGFDHYILLEILLIKFYCILAYP